MSTIASLDVDLALNSAKFVEGLRKARKEHEDFAKSLSEFAEKANRMTESLGVHVDTTSAISGMVEKAREAEESQAKLSAVLEATGHAAGISAGGMHEVAEELSRVTTFSIEAARGAETVLATFTHVRGDQFREAIRAAADLSTIFGVDLTTAAQKLGRALENPGEGLKYLAKMGVQFTEGQKKVIQDLVDTGHVAEAQEQILKAVNAKVGGSAEAAAKTAGGALKQLKNAYDELAAVVGSYVVPVVQTASTAINGISTAAAAATKAVKLFGEAEQFAASAAAVLAAVTNPAALGIILIAGAAGTAIYELIEHLKEATHASDSEASAHDRAAASARNHATALEELKQRAKAILDDQAKLAENYEKELSGDSRPAFARIRDDLRFAEQHRKPGDDQSLASLAASYHQAMARDAAEELTQQHTEMSRAADRIRDSILTPIDRFHAAIKELATLVSSKALDPASAMQAAVNAGRELLRSSPAQSPVAAAALSQGTAAAYSAAQRNDREDAAREAAQQQLDAARKQADNVEAFGNAVDAMRQDNTTLSIN